ncbi:hypothetical protein PMAYCL1PPCAC_01187, partial [Pristionchus mayeri]
EIRSLRVKCDEVLRVRERIEKMEEKIKGFSVKHPMTNNDVTAVKVQQPDAIEDSSDSWAKEAGAFFFDVFECFRGNAELDIDKDNLQLLECRVHKLNEDGGNILFQALFRGFKEAKIPSDIQNVNSILIEMITIAKVRKMQEEDTEKVRVHRNRFPSMSLDDPELRPTSEFIETHNQFFTTATSQLPSVGVELAATVLRIYHEHPNVVQVEAEELLEHIGNAKTRCFSCKLIFADVFEYFGHPSTFFHIRESGLHDAATFMSISQLLISKKLLPYL